MACSKCNKGKREHAKGKCDIKKKMNHRQLAKKARRQAKRQQQMLVKRATVAGIHKVSASSGQSRKTKKKVVEGK